MHGVTGAVAPGHFIDGLMIVVWLTRRLTATIPPALRAITHGPGWFTREEVIEHYEEMTGRNLSQIIFYETFARFKVAVVIQQIYFRYIQRQTQDERFRNFDSLVIEPSPEALELAQRSQI